MDAKWMAQAIKATVPTRPHPNPRVGAIVLDEVGDLIGPVAHRGAGEPHAEDLVLSEAGSRAQKGTLYVTLEPCVHHGRTPPCVSRIIQAGIRRVVIGAKDPDARVEGRGIAALKEAGIEVAVGVLEAEVEASDPSYFHHRRTGRPMVTLKAAATLDGQVAAANGSSRWITGPDARRDAHSLRARSDAVMIGAGTLRVDNPRLTVRLDDYQGPQPIPVLVAGLRPIPEGCHLLERDDLIVVSPFDRPESVPRVLVAPNESGDAVDLAEALNLLGREGLLDLLTEGGSKLFGALLGAGLADRMVLYYGNRLAGGVGRPLFEGVFRRVDDAAPWQISDVRKVGNALRVEARPEDS